ncbi:hypothetical protein F5884DRAFT_745045 [Xylogone sp. PMI_703]|nr:hypothetical protein F5884DRAFT_745045 [Xylogone sp. PMI_703]
MDSVQASRSIRERKKEVLGIYSFSEPVTLKYGQEKGGKAESGAQKRQKQIRQAQRSHRQRTQDYMRALENEILRLRGAERELSQISNDWKRCSTALIGPSRDMPSLNRRVGQMRPGVFLWLATGELSSEHLPIFPFTSGATSHVNYSEIPPSLEIFDSMTRELLFNFCENVAPTLDATELARNGYTKHIVPLSLESDMVRNALLAASASQMQTTRRTMMPRSLGYKSAAIRGLQQASQQLATDISSALLTLATILGLLIDDMINDNREFPVLLKLADSWTTLNPSDNNRSNDPLGRFILDQIQMLKALVHPLYQFTQSYNPTKKMISSGNLTHPPLSHSKLYDIFAILESATAQACSIYSYKGSPSSAENAGTSTTELDLLLDNLQSTTTDIPPYAPGENSLAWVYSIALSRSTLPKHCAFFNSRLAELLRRIGYQNISDYLATVSMYKN